MTPRVEVRGLGLSRGGEPALAGVSFSLAPGETCAVLGFSGSGKTTLLRLVAGLETPDAGEILLEGALASVPGLARLEPKDRGLGWVPQGDSLWPQLDCFENAAFPLRSAGLSEGEVRVRAEAALEAVGAAALARRRPSEISGGERRRVALARALARRPSLLLLDEPLAGLDRPARDEILAVVARALKDSGAAALLVTHDRDEAALAPRWLILEAGRLVQDGAPAEIRRSPASPGVARLLGL